MSTRLIDVFITGPLQIYTGLYIQDDIWLRRIMVGIGISTILYNLHNYLVVDERWISNRLGPFTHDTNGKTQIHRLYNLSIMYPLFMYVYINYPTPLSKLFLLNIVIGFMFNLRNFISLASFEHLPSIRIEKLWNCTLDI